MKLSFKVRPVYSKTCDCYNILGVKKKKSLQETDKLFKWEEV